MRRFIARAKGRLRYPPWRYRRSGGVRATVTRANGRVEDLGIIADTYSRRWRARS